MTATGRRLVLHGLSTCDTCRKAAKTLGDSDWDVTRRDVRDTPLTPPEIERFLAAFGADLINRRSTTWRDLPPDARERAPAALLADHPTLMKRPVIETPDGALHLGWTPATRAALGL